jgi:hypothetical protein
VTTGAGIVRSSADQSTAAHRPAGVGNQNGDGLGVPKKDELRTLNCGVDV